MNHTKRSLVLLPLCFLWNSPAQPTLNPAGTHKQLCRFEKRDKMQTRCQIPHPPATCNYGPHVRQIMCVCVCVCLETFFFCEAPGIHRHAAQSIVSSKGPFPPGGLFSSHVCLYFFTSSCMPSNDGCITGTLDH